jgi:hypothetical protein
MRYTGKRYSSNSLYTSASAYTSGRPKKQARLRGASPGNRGADKASGTALCTERWPVSEFHQRERKDMCKARLRLNMVGGSQEVDIWDPEIGNGQGCLLTD